MRSSGINIIVSTLMVGSLLTACADLKEAGKEIGHGTRDAAKAIGHGTRDVTKAIGHASRDAVKTVGDGVEKAVKPE